jgi:hypothetical protein
MSDLQKSFEKEVIFLHIKKQCMRSKSPLIAKFAKKLLDKEVIFFHTPK